LLCALACALTPELLLINNFGPVFRLLVYSTV
jgi:hypothetical protein